MNFAQMLVAETDAHIATLQRQRALYAAWPGGTALPRGNGTPTAARTGTARGTRTRNRNRSRTARGLAAPTTAPARR